MKISIATALISLSMFFAADTIIAQEHHEEKEEAFVPHSSFALMLIHAHALSGSEAVSKKNLVLPAWKIDFNYRFKSKWSIGLHTDIILESFEVASSKDGKVIERNYPIAPALMASYKLNHDWSFLGGTGGEFAREETFFLTRFGIEYGVEIRNNWEIIGSLS
jgi:hypothetical protein